MTRIAPARPTSRPPGFGIGHNHGPPIDTGWHLYCWQQAHQKAWKNPPLEVVRLRMRRANALGMTYREYASIVLDTGRYP